MAFRRRTLRNDTRDLETLLKLSTGQISARDVTIRYARGIGRSSGLGQLGADILGQAAGALHDAAAPIAARAARTLLNALRWNRGGLAAKTIRAREAREAVTVLQGMGIETPLAEDIFGRQSRSAEIEAPPVQAPPVQPGYGGRGGNRGRGVAAPAPAPESEPPGMRRPGRVGGSRMGHLYAPPRPGEDHPFAREILTPQSSNVFSFTYDYETSTLLVTYKAPKLNPDAVHHGRGRGGKQLVGKLGSTIIGKTNERGPLYAYFDVPQRVYQRMILAASKGKFVWDELRVRGTVYGHQYRYQLMQGAFVTAGSIAGVYIPRRATQKGFRTRARPDVGSGRRGFEESTLAAEERDFTQRSRDRGRHRGRGRGRGN